jgi:hypothetical protein
VLWFGYTYQHIDELAHVAARASLARRGWLDPSDVYEVCWGTIVEQLYTATTAPFAGRLVWDARQAVAKAARHDRRHHGFDRDSAEPQQRDSARNYCRYWDWHTRTTPGPERGVVEREALWHQHETPSKMWRMDRRVTGCGCTIRRPARVYCVSVRDPAKASARARAAGMVGGRARATAVSA